MRICRFQQNGHIAAGFYFDSYVVPVGEAARAYRHATGEQLSVPDGDDLLQFLPPDGGAQAAARKLADWVRGAAEAGPSAGRLPVSELQLLLPIPRPNKLFLLAGNYAAHIQEGGEIAAERAETFPYVFMKPPTTTLTHPSSPVTIPAVSPGTIDYELELAVVMGRRAKGVKEQDALDYVAGYTVMNDISNRKFRPNPERKEREKDKFFDWLHGKWHDSFCPCGPCITPRHAIADPQSLTMQLRVNGQLRQDASTSLQVFPVAAVIEFLSSFVTLEPGDIISTGTPAGVGGPQGIFLQPGDRIEATIGGIGTLLSTIVSEREVTRH